MPSAKSPKSPRSPRYRHSKKARKQKPAFAFPDDEDEPHRPEIVSKERAVPFLVWNKYLLYGYRLNHRTYGNCVSSLFTLHNESVNVWSHLVGAFLFVWALCYMTFYMQPPSIDLRAPMLEGSLMPPTCLEPGTFDSMSVRDRQQFCLEESQTLLSMMLGSKWLDEWHAENDAVAVQSRLHYNLNYHHDAFEAIEYYLKNAIAVLEKPHDQLQSCSACYDELLHLLPSYIEDRTETFITQIQNYDSYTMDNLTQAEAGKALFTRLEETQDEYALTRLFNYHIFSMKDVVDPKNDFDTFMKTKVSKVRSLQAQISQRLTSSAERNHFIQGEADQAVHVVTRVPLLINLISAICCCGFSTYCHLFGCMSPAMEAHSLAVDLAGIAIMIGGSYTAPLYYGFYCDEYTIFRNLYIGAIWCCVTLALVFTVSPAQKLLSNQQRQMAQFLMFTASALAGAPAVFHLRYFTDPSLVYDFKKWPYITEGLLYGVGGLIFALQVPERWYQGKFDYFGQSHNIFHFCVLAAAILHTWAVVRDYHKRQLYPCPENFTLYSL